jgi:hypothetical protein
VTTVASTEAVTARTFDRKDPTHRGPVPGWLLAECARHGKPTGLVGNGLDENVLGTDPRNIEAGHIRGW